MKAVAVTLFASCLVGLAVAQRGRLTIQAPDTAATDSGVDPSAGAAAAAGGGGPLTPGGAVAAGLRAGIPVIDPATGKKQFPLRNLPADALRDFPGLCFGSTTLKLYNIGDEWSLAPFCGLATCRTDGVHLIESVQDCGILPKPNAKCTIINEDSRNLTFPLCCPEFECEEGVQLEYPSLEELRAAAQPPPGAAGGFGGPGPLNSRPPQGVASPFGALGGLSGQPQIRGQQPQTRGQQPASSIRG